MKIPISAKSPVPTTRPLCKRGLLGDFSALVLPLRLILMRGVVRLVHESLCGDSHLDRISSAFIHVVSAEAELLKPFLFLHLLRSRGTFTRAIVVDVIPIGLRRARQIRRTDR